MNQENRDVELNFFQWPSVGSFFTVLSGLSFLFVCMLLPLVGRAGSVAPAAGKNRLAFLGAVLFSLLLGGLATLSKMERRKIDGSPLPYFSLGLMGLCLALLLALFAGLLSL